MSTKNDSDRHDGGTSVERSDILGNPYTQHYDADGNETGTSVERKDILGNPYTEHRDPDGNETGTSVERKDILGNPYAEHRDSDGNETGTSVERKDILGTPYTDHTHSTKRHKVGDGRNRSSGFGGGASMSNGQPLSLGNLGCFLLVALSVLAGTGFGQRWMNDHSGWFDRFMRTIDGSSAAREAESNGRTSPIVLAPTPHVGEPGDEKRSGEAPTGERRAKIISAVGSARLREMPEMSSKTGTFVSVGTVVQVDMASKVVRPGKKSPDTWYRVRVPGPSERTGWMHEAVLEFE